MDRRALPCAATGDAVPPTGADPVSNAPPASERSPAPRAHGHAGHDHLHAPDLDRADARRLVVALALTLGFMAVEIVSGILGHSLALLSDATHTLTDAAALGMSLVVIHLVRRPAGGDLTFGLRRAEILSAQANGATLLVLSLLIVYGAIHRLIAPVKPAGLVVLLVALAGVVFNLLATRQLARANRGSLNIEGSFQHLLTDLYAFGVTAVAGVVILTTGFVRADAIAALVVAALMLRAAYGLLRDSGRVLLEAAPAGMSVAEIGDALARNPRVESVHDLHVWEVGSGFPSLSAHVLVAPGEDCHAVRRELEAMLLERFGFEHTTIQVDHRRDAGLLSLGTLRAPARDVDA
jgi:cobalt-zinc-cadmium efflux system protein